MGFLDEGKVLAWEDAQEAVKYVKEHGVEQFIRIYNECKDRHAPDLLWGDELEYIIACQSKSNEKETFLCLRGPELLAAVKDLANNKQNRYDEVNWHPEYGAFMIEATPAEPYNGLAIDHVEENMKLRRELIEKLLQPGEMLLALVSFPRLGAQTGLWKERINSPFTHPPLPVGGSVTLSQYVPDQIINPHPRFAALTANIRKRKGGKVCICSPLFVDEFTAAVPNHKHESLSSVSMTPASPTHFFMSDAMEEDLAGKSRCCQLSDVPAIHMDAMAFGMGCCCLQVTMQCPTLEDARYLTDQLAVLAPYFLALTAAAPIFKGLLAETDARWNVISASVDDRTPQELAGPNKIDKSRYDSVSCFISDSPLLDDRFHNDIPLQINQTALERLRQSGIDERLSRHVAHLFIRDPLVIYDHKLEIDDNKYLDHWENIQSTNWQSVRFKPPPNNSNIGWRVEFRVMEIQPTEFENAAFAVFIALLTQTIRHFKLNLYIPISKVDQNMRHSQSPNAIKTHAFFWRDLILPPTDPNFAIFYEPQAAQNYPTPNSFHEATVHQILFGNSKTGFKGLVGGMWAILPSLGVVEGTPQHQKLQKYVDFIALRASAQVMTPATWMRHFVCTHPLYGHDSIVSPEIAHDLMQRCNQIAHGQKEPLLHANLL